MKWRFQKVLLIVVTSLVMGFIFATTNAKDIYVFDANSQQQLFEKITAELRCLVCQNESLLDSNAALAKDLRSEVYNQVKKGSDEKTIKAYLVQRYGQFILFKPAFNGLTFFLWITPFLLILIAFSILILLMGKRKKMIQKLTLSDEEKQRLDNLFKKEDSRG